MAKAFSTKNYFKKIYSRDLLVEFYKRHGITCLFEITEQTSRKNVVSILSDFYVSLSPEQKIAVEKELALIDSVSSKHTPSLIASILTEKKAVASETQIECISDHDKVLYRYMFDRDIFDNVLFFHDFYTTRGYMLYEAKKVDITPATLSMTELQREFTRIIQKDDAGRECEFTYQTLDGLLYLMVTFDGASLLEAKRDVVTGELDRTRTVKKQEVLKIVYLIDDAEVLITYTGTKYEKLIFLDTYLRIICKGGYDAKVESFSLTAFHDQHFDFRTTNKGVPLLTWKIKAITLSFGGDASTKKRMRLTLPSTVQENGLAPLTSTLEEIGILQKLKEYTVENVALSFSFTNAQKPDKSILVPCTLSRTKSSLCPLFPYDRLARTLLKQAHIELGFIEQSKKEEEVTKKWDL